MHGTLITLLCATSLMQNVHNGACINAAIATSMTVGFKQNADKLENYVRTKSEKKYKEIVPNYITIPIGLAAAYQRDGYLKTGFRAGKVVDRIELRGGEKVAGITLIWSF